MNRDEALQDLLQELTKHIDRRIEQTLGARRPFALFLFDGREAHAASTGEWDAVRDAITVWTEQDRTPQQVFSLREQ